MEYLNCNPEIHMAEACFNSTVVTYIHIFFLSLSWVWTWIWQNQNTFSYSYNFINLKINLVWTKTLKSIHPFNWPLPVTPDPCNAISRQQLTRWCILSSQQCQPSADLTLTHTLLTLHPASFIPRDAYTWPVSISH